VQTPLRVLSIGRLVQFKGFDVLIAACAELKRLGVEFTCEIVGDGPMRDALQTQVAELGLDSVVTLTGALPQQAVFEKLRSCDVFALASVLDDAGASDVFPTVILEAMASSRPVVSTTVAGIPEAVVHGLTGLLVPAGDSEALAKAIERLALDQWLRVTFGTAARRRVEQYFQVETTVAPLMALFERIGDALPPAPEVSAEPERQHGEIAYLIETWPDPELPSLEAEILQMKDKGVKVVGFVCEAAADVRLDSRMKKLAAEFEFLPDASVIEAEWQANREAAHEFEEQRANEKHRAPAAMFLQQARYAVALRPLLQERKIAHVHATSSRMLLTALILKRLLGLTASAAIEPQTKMPAAVIAATLRKCEGGRVPQRKLATALGSSFLLEASRLPKPFTALSGAVGLDLAGRAKLWQEWSDLLLRWR
jgi:hypothetical protein